MSCTSAAMAPSGRHVARRWSATPLSASIWSSQVGSAVIGSSLHRHVEAADVEVVVGPALVGGQAVLLGRVPVGAGGADAMGFLPLEDVLFDRRRELQVEPFVDAADRALRIADEVAVVDIEEPVLADAGPLVDGVLHALPQV